MATMLTMRHFAAILAFCLGASSCGSEEGSNSAISCSVSERVGTYTITGETVSGNCGEFPERIERVENQSLPVSCSFLHQDVWSEADCKLERSYTCDAPDLGDGFKREATAVTRQIADDGSLVTGTVTMRVLRPDETLACLGTYKVTFTRL